MVDYNDILKEIFGIEFNWFFNLFICLFVCTNLVSQKFRVNEIRRKKKCDFTTKPLDYKLYIIETNRVILN